MRQHYKPLDGLRGIAILIVLVAHGTPLYVSGAFGVDIFFVLSGFLITHILASEAGRTNTIEIKRFYARRFLRLLPALWLTIGGLAAFKLVAGSLNRHFLSEATCALSYSMNFVSALGIGEPSQLAHTWSLAIEEQYYLVWPIVLLLLHRAKLLPRTQAIILAIASLAVIIYRYEGGFSPTRIYHGSDTHCDGLLLGSAVALWLLDGRRLGAALDRIVALAAPIAFCLLLALPTQFGWDSRFTIEYGYGVVAALSGLVIIRVTQHPASRLATVLSWRPLVFVGKISYGLYLYHWPVLVWLRSQPWPEIRGGRFVVCMVVSFSLSIVSYFLVERPVLGLKERRFGSVTFERAEPAHDLRTAA